MTTLFRLAFAALLFSSLAPEALAQDHEAVVITRTADGFVLAAPGDAPVGDSPAALLMHVGDNAWSMRVLASGDVPSEAAAHPPSTTVRALTAAREAELDRHIASAERQMARYEAALADYEALLSGDESFAEPNQKLGYSVAGYVQDGVAETLARLAHSNALVSLESAVHGNGKTRITARYLFSSVAAWDEWNERPETQAILDGLEQRTTRYEAHAR